jgi:hypothetical protein
VALVEKPNKNDTYSIAVFYIIRISGKRILKTEEGSSGSYQIEEQERAAIMCMAV